MAAPEAPSGPPAPGSVHTIAEVIAGLQALDRALPASDWVRWFNRLYLDVTLAVHGCVAGGKLAARRVPGGLDVPFGNRYFEVYNAASSGTCGGHPI